MNKKLNFESLEQRKLMTASQYADLDATPIDAPGNTGSQLLFAPQRFVVGDKLVYASRTDDLRSFDIWADDGEIPVRIAADLQLPSPFSPTLDVVEFYAFSLGDRALFFVTQDIERVVPNERNVVRQTWVTDGTPEGTTILDESPDRFLYSIGFDKSDATAMNPTATAIVFGDSLLFENVSAEAGSEVWITDGTKSGTALLKDIAPGPASSSPTDFATANGLAYFTASGKLWQSDGTAEGTVEALSSPVNTNRTSIALTEVGGKTIFVDRSTPNTKLLMLDENSASTSGTPTVIAEVPKSIANLNVVGETLFFTTVVSESSGEDLEKVSLWSTDGNSPPQELLTDIAVTSRPPNLSDNIPASIFEANGKLGFINFNSEGVGELWTSDGTTHGTQKVRNLGEFVPEPSFYATTLGDLSYFTFADKHNGLELWVTDGSGAGTFAYDINPGSAGAKPFDFAHWRGELYFSADDGRTGREIWKVDGNLPTRGDISGDGFITPRDFLQLSVNFGKTEDAAFSDGDLDGDGDVDFADFLAMAQDWENDFVPIVDR